MDWFHTFFKLDSHQIGRMQPRLLAIITALMGIVNVLSGLTPALAARMRLLARISPLEVRHGGHLTSVLAGFALLLLANGLWRRKQNAWRLTLLILALSIIVHLIKGIDYEEAALAAFLVFYLWRQRAHFQALSDAPSLRQGVYGLVAALVFTLAYGVIGFYLLDRHFDQAFSLGAAVRQTVTMFTQFYDPGLQPLTGFGRYFARSIYLVGMVAMSYGLLMLMRPVLLRAPASASERARARQNVAQFGRTSLARFALFPDKSYFFYGNRSMVAYVVKERIALVLGDPIGPAEDAAECIRAFHSFCARNDWQPVFFQTMPDYLDAYRAQGFSVLGLGQEAIVETTSFSLAGGANKPLRTAVNRMTKLGYHSQAYLPPISATILEQLREVSDEWLALTHGAEKRFSMGWFDDAYVTETPVLVVHAPDGVMTAFVNLVGEYQANELAVDLMRRRKNVENGTMEFLFVALLTWAKAQGYATVSLGMSALFGVGSDAMDPPPERALHYLYEHVNRFYNFKGLHAFKAKFHPQWSPRFLIYPNFASLLSVALALNRATDGDRFLLDYVRDLVARRHATRTKEQKA